MSRVLRLLAPTVLAVAALAATAPAGRAADSGGTVPGEVVPGQAVPGSVLVVGDSLAVGMRPFLDPLLAGRPVQYSVRSGITSPQGLERLRFALRTVQPETIVISLGTNDGPDPRRFASRIRRALRAAPLDACVVWPALHRAPRKGRFAAMNAELRAAGRRDGRLTVVGWDRLVSRGAVRLPDGVHPDAAGYEHLARSVFRAIQRRCTSP